MPSFDNIGDKITEIFVDWLKDLINLFIEFLKIPYLIMMV